MVRLVAEKALAIKMRLEGKSYSQIKGVVGVSKSTLSLWLRNYPLAAERIYELQHNERRIERFRASMRHKKEMRLRKVYLREKGRLLPLTKKELFIAGLFLYWGEGGKTQESTVGLSNTNPRIVKFFLYWLVKVLRFPKEKIRVRLHIYSDMNEEKAVGWWRQQLGLRRSQFRKCYVKKTTLQGLTYKGFGHGTCNILAGGRDLRDRIMMGIEVVDRAYVA